jgi:3-deoxy-manno-octulosonate cytidylyltransferase (CMP-KDO synthetase)
VATDDLRIADAVRAFGGEPVMTRADHPSGTDRIAEAVQNLDVTAVVNIQGDEPLIDPALIDELAALVDVDGAWDMATAAARMDDPSLIAQSSVVKVVMDAEGRALYFSRAPIPYARDQAGGIGEVGSYWRHIGIYAYRRTFLARLVATPPVMLEETEKLEQLRALYIGGRIKVLSAPGVALGVDEPGDVPRAERALREAGLVN